MSNCKPGDLAVIVRSDISDWIGVLVTVVDRNDWWSTRLGNLHWNVIAHSTGTRDGIFRDGSVVSCTPGANLAAADASLRPIRPPADDKSVRGDQGSEGGGEMTDREKLIEDLRMLQAHGPTPVDKIARAARIEIETLQDEVDRLRGGMRETAEFVSGVELGLQVPSLADMDWRDQHGGGR